VQPVESHLSLAHSHRPTSEPITRLSRQQQQLQHHLVARLKVASDDALHSSHAKKPKPGTDAVAAVGIKLTFSFNLTSKLLHLMPSLERN